MFSFVKRIKSWFRHKKAKAVSPTPIKTLKQNPLVRDKILEFEDRVKQMPGAMTGDCFPLKHVFVEGAYVREITMPKGMVVISKIHKVCHPYFILKGEVSVLTEEGPVRLKAPYSGITPAGTKRILYIHEDTVWTTVHVTDKTKLEEIEEDIIAKNFDELELDSNQEREKLLNFVNAVHKIGG